MAYTKKVGLEEAVDILMDPESEYDVIIKEGEGIILSQPDDDATPIFREILRESYAPPKKTWKERLIDILSKE